MAHTSLTGFGLAAAAAGALAAASGAALAAPTGPSDTIDPNLSPAQTEDYDPNAPNEGYEAPPADWQLGVPVWYRGGRAYLVPDGPAFLEQLPETIRAQCHLDGSVKGLGDVVIVPDNDNYATRVRYVGRGGVFLGNGSGGVYFGYGNSPGLYYYHDDGSGPWWYTTGRRRWYHYGYEYRYPYGPVDGQLSPGYAPVRPAPEPEPELTDVQTADVALASGSYAYAIEKYRAHLTTEPGDMEAMRHLAVALLGDHRPGDAAAAILYAYAGDATLAHRPLSLEVTGGRRLELRDLLTAAVRYARVKPSGATWLLVTALSQASGQPEAAGRFLDKAEAQGLDAEIVRTLRVELVRR